MRWYSVAAKVNLVLEVGPLRRDGFHDVETVMATLSLRDRLGVEASEGFSLEVSDAAGGEAPDCGPPEDNLVLRAARALAEVSGLGGAHYHLEKSIPAQAGLGGGSADAAAALVALRDLHAPDLPEDVLFEVAAGLGSDVPFFLLASGYGRGRGRGEEVEALAGPTLPALVVAPAAGMSTPRAYQALDRARMEAATVPPNHSGPLGSRSDALVRALEEGAEAIAGACANDFEVVEGDMPGCAEARARLRAAGALRVLLSGSGSALVGLFSDARARDQALAALDAGGLRGGPWAVELGVPPIVEEEAAT